MKEALDCNQQVDRDCFLKINGLYIHYASNGGLLPISFVERNEQLGKIVKRMPDIYVCDDLIINPKLREILKIEDLRDEYEIVLSALNITLGNDVINSYLEKLYIPAFSKFARKGFISFDSDGDDKAFWVVRPSTEIASIDLDENEVPNIEISGIDLCGDNPYPLIPLYNSAKDLE